MSMQAELTRTILVVEDVHETRDGIEILLHADGYRVALARDEADAMASASQKSPDLILVSLAGLPHEVVLSACRIREHAVAGENIPIVVFCVEGLADGEEAAIGRGIYVTRPDNFNQLRTLLARLLSGGSLVTRLQHTTAAAELKL
jgi:DNA-binding response OmpR family regulator